MDDHLTPARKAGDEVDTQITHIRRRGYVSRIHELALLTRRNVVKKKGDMVVQIWDRTNRLVTSS